MGVWDIYSARVGGKGINSRAASLIRERQLLRTKLPYSLSYHQAEIDGVPRELAIINSDNLDQKTIISMPGETLPHGGLVDWMDNKWLITEVDANNELYTKGIMLQCNYLLRWIGYDGSIVERWCVVEDGTRYLVGEASGDDYVITTGDFRVSLTIARDAYTLRMRRGDRFLINDYDSPDVIAYRLTKPFKIGQNHGGTGVFTFILKECNTEDSDNIPLRIANYYDHFPREDAISDTDADTSGQQGAAGNQDGSDGGRTVWF